MLICMYMELESLETTKWEINVDEYIVDTWLHIYLFIHIWRKVKLYH